MFCHYAFAFARRKRYHKPVHYYVLDTDNHQKELVLAHKKGIRLPDYMRAMIRLFQAHGAAFLSEFQNGEA